MIMYLLLGIVHVRQKYRVRFGLFLNIFYFVLEKWFTTFKKKKQAKRPQNDVVFWYLFNILKKIIVY